MSEKKTTEMNELLDEANEMSLGEEASAGIKSTVLISLVACGGPVTPSFITKSVVCKIKK